MKSIELSDEWGIVSLQFAISPSKDYVMVNRLDDKMNVIRSQGVKDKYFINEVIKFLKFIDNK